MSTFRFTRYCQIALQSGCIHLYSHEIQVRGPGAACLTNVWYCRPSFAAHLMDALLSWPSQDAAHKKMEQLRQDYIEMKALIDASEASSTQKIKEEEKRVSSKFDNIYQILLKKKNEIEILKEEIELALTEGDEFEFLEVGLDEDIIGHSAWHDSVVYRCPGALKELGCKRSLEASPTHAQYPFSMLCDNQPQT